MSKTTLTVLRNLLPNVAEQARIVDAKKPLLVAPTKADARNAQRLDPAHCLYANACNRRGRPAVFLRHVAYVRRSATRIDKFMIPPAGRAQIIALDASGIAVAGASIWIMPPVGIYKVGARTGDRSHGHKGKRLSKRELARRRAARDALPTLRKL